VSVAAMGLPCLGGAFSFQFGFETSVMHRRAATVVAAHTLCKWLY
jgi:hypothetical protein